MRKVGAEEKAETEEGGQIGCGTRQKGGHLKHREEWPEEPGEVSRFHVVLTYKVMLSFVDFVLCG